MVVVEEEEDEEDEEEDDDESYLSEDVKCVDSIQISKIKDQKAPSDAIPCSLFSSLFSLVWSLAPSSPQSNRL